MHFKCHCRLRQACHPHVSLWAGLGSMTEGAVKQSYQKKSDGKHVQYCVNKIEVQNKSQSYPAINLTNREHIRLVFCLQNYNKIRNTAMDLKNNIRN